MAKIRIDSESELIEELRKSKAYQEFRNEQLPHKIKREQQAWSLIQKNNGQYTKDALNHIFDTVDFYEGNKRWFGQLLATPNRNWVFESSLQSINLWLTTLLFSSLEPEKAINTCLKELKIKGASKGLVTLLLYLSDPQTYNIWVNKTQEGLMILGRTSEFRSNNWGAHYISFNQTTAEFRDKFEFQPQEVDWILTFIASCVESEENHFLIEEDLLETEQVVIVVDDEEDDLDDIVGQPMELRVMRWTPTNEMGVVALFIEFRKELGFPFVEVIRTRFPDAVVFESSPKGYIRRYVEFEFRSSGFKSHVNSKRKCHYVVCWEHDWKDCPIPVIELRTAIPALL